MLVAGEDLDFLSIFLADFFFHTHSINIDLLYNLSVLFDEFRAGIQWNVKISDGKKTQHIQISVVAAGSSIILGFSLSSL